MAGFSLTAPRLASTESAAEPRPLTTADVKALYARPPSFTDFLPWVEYLPDSRCFLLEDGVSVGALFELTPAGTEARTPGFMAELRDAIQTAITEAIPELDDAPWIVQLYVQDEPSLSDLLRQVEAYLPAGASESAYTRHYLELLMAHCARISRPGGLFEDSALTGTVWRGQVRRVRAVLYRRLNPRGRVRSRSRPSSTTSPRNGRRRSPRPGSNAGVVRGRISTAGCCPGSTHGRIARRATWSSSSPRHRIRAMRTCRSVRILGRC
jgi:hypothetical protein